MKKLLTIVVADVGNFDLRCACRTRALICIWCVGFCGQRRSMLRTMADTL